MTAFIDIFRVEAAASVLWLESAATIEDALGRVRVLALDSPSEYMIFDQKTGLKKVIDHQQLELRRPAQSELQGAAQ